MIYRLPNITLVSGPMFRLVWLGVVAAVLLMMAYGCGQKSPPVAPQQAPLVAVTDLQAQLDRDRVTLTWQHSPENQRATGYLVLRAQTALTQPDCPGCPLVFQKVQTVRMSRPRRKQQHTLTFTQPLSGDFSYAYSVRPLHASGGQGPDSNLVEIDGFPSDMSEPD